ncbi:MAG: hypothetical protein JW753_01715 [Dehalococcoidia bacterium]|nr:hypothetical protein [Dehalococcoidia bacterium]
MGEDCSAAVLSFLKQRLKGWHNAHFTPDIPAEKETNARANCRIPDEDRILVLVDNTLFGSAKDCLVFTESAIYEKSLGRDPIAISYQELPPYPYPRFREIFPSAPDSSEKDLAIVCQQVKTVVMYGDSDYRKPPPDPDKDPHPVQSWLKNAAAFILLVIAIPGVTIQLLATRGYARASGALCLVSLLSWLTWFHSYRVSAEKAKLFAVSTLLKRIAFGAACAAGVAGAVLWDRYAASESNVELAEAIPLVAVSVFGGAVVAALILFAQRSIHSAQRGPRVRRVVARYMNNKQASGTAGLGGLLDAGVCDLSSDIEIKEVCAILTSRSEEPLGPYRDLLAHTDLMALFDYARDRGYDFRRHGDPHEIVKAIGQSVP